MINPLVRIVVLAAAVTFVFSMATFIPSPALAGGLSSFLGLVRTETRAAAPESDRSITSMALLRAAVAPDGSLGTGGGDVTIIEESMLQSESGPLGPQADAADWSTPNEISVYVVRKGDSLSVIAKMFGVSVSTIVWANDIKRGIIHEGDTLVVLPISGVLHTVKKGDTLETIAKKYKADRTEIIEFNGLDGDAPLTVGSEITIPDGELATAPTPTAPVRSGSSGPSYPGYYMRPVDGPRTQGLHGYNGIDLGAPAGTPIRAAASGDVIISKSSGWNGGYGLYVVIRHDNGTQTLYAHDSVNLVTVGEHVVKGQIIGRVGSTGKSTGPHLHFEVRGARNPF